MRGLRACSQHCQTGWEKKTQPSPSQEDQTRLRQMPKLVTKPFECPPLDKACLVCVRVYMCVCVCAAGWQLACLPMLISFACMSDKVPMNMFVVLPLAKAVLTVGEDEGNFGGGV